MYFGQTGWRIRKHVLVAWMSPLQGSRRMKGGFPNLEDSTGSQFSSIWKTEHCWSGLDPEAIQDTHMCTTPTSCWSVWLPGLWDVSFPDWGPSNSEGWDEERGEREVQEEGHKCIPMADSC